MAVSDESFDPEAIGPDPSNDPALVLQRGIELYRAKRYADAMHEFNIAFGLDVEESTALYWMACIHFHERRYNDAILLVRRHLILHPSDAAAHLVMGKALLELGRPEEARSHLMRSAEINRTHTVDTAMLRCNQALAQIAEATGAKPNYSEIAWSEIRIPTAFQFSLDPDELAALQPSTLDSIKLHIRVVFALVRREMLTRFGHSRLGYVWALLQPLVLVSIMYGVFAVLHRRLPTGVTPIGFLLTGFMSFMFFSETRNRVGQSLRGNLALLHFRQVTLYSLILGRVTLEFLTSLSISLMMVLMSALIGEKVDIDNPFLILWGIVMLTLFGMEFGIIVVAFSKLIPAIEHISHGINRILFLVSGIWFYANELPASMRNFFLYNPIFNVLEFIRDGYFKTYTAEYASMTYVHECVLLGGFFALSLKRILYHRLIDNRS